MSRRRIGVLSRGIRRIPALAQFLDAEVVFCSGLFAPRNLDAIAGWGRRPGTARARRYAARHGLPFIALEDGFLRSLGLGSEDPPLSLVIDDEGIYYDASGPSRLERLVGKALDAEQLARSEALIAAWRRERVSKYNALRDHAGVLPARFVLVADQTRGDASVAYGLADQASFERMLQAALAENPGCTVLLKTHPDVFAGKARGHIDLQRAAARPRVRVLAENVHPAALLERAEAVYVVSSQLGFEALLWGRRLRVFGMPFYAGWGLSHDELPAPERRMPATLAQLAHAALVDYPRYLDPDRGTVCGPEVVLAHLGLQRRMHARFPPVVHALGFSPWKKPLLRRYFAGSNLRFVRSPHAVPRGATLAVWGRQQVVVAADTERVHLEDGFLRSVGLGADLVRPLSWVMDRRGIYFDARSPSDLEHLLEHHEFDAPLLERAAQLRRGIVAAGLTKYNVGARTWQRPPGVARVVLVVGQVESDAAIALATPGIASNIELLRAARAANPEAWILYKPHPDVVAGLRRAGHGEHEAAACCDEIVLDCPMGELLEAVDEVQVLTSLAGFEALLRGKRVVCHGLPFYAGWGLTEDRHALARRTRRRGLDELVAATLLLYPAYLGWRTRRFTDPGNALLDLAEWQARERAGRPPWRALLRPLLVLLSRTR
ncbi:MAG: capsular polysaccharide biosynthesis protein [Gammaproteobacteria bacterium]|nr:capsular polysaccharide biosynthesis protein [Gammaproteobacteria bacterium]